MMTTAAAPRIHGPWDRVVHPGRDQRADRAATAQLSGDSSAGSAARIRRAAARAGRGTYHLGIPRPCLRVR